MPSSVGHARGPGALSRLLLHLRPYRRRVWLAASCSVINKIFDLAPPVLIGLAVDVVVQQDTSWLAQLGASTVPTQLTVLAGLSFIVWTAESVFEYLYGVLWRNWPSPHSTAFDSRPMTIFRNWRWIFSSATALAVC